MITEPPAELRRSRDRPAGDRSRETRQEVRVRSVAVPRARIGGGHWWATYARQLCAGTASSAYLDQSRTALAGERQAPPWKRSQRMVGPP